MPRTSRACSCGCATLWSNTVPPRLGEYSVFGVLGCVVSAFLGLRLLWKIWRNE